MNKGAYGELQQHMRSDEHGGVRTSVNPQSNNRDVSWMCLSFLGTKRGTRPLHELEIEATKNPTVFRGYKRLSNKRGGLDVCWCQLRRMHEKEHDPDFRTWVMELEQDHACLHDPEYADALHVTM